MTRRISLAENFMAKKSTKAYLSRPKHNVCLTVLKGNRIDIGKEIFLETGNIVIICAKDGENLIVSISRYDEDHSFYEFFYCNTSLNQLHKAIDDVPSEYKRYIMANIKRLRELEPKTEAIFAVQ